MLVFGAQESVSSASDEVSGDMNNGEMHICARRIVGVKVVVVPRGEEIASMCEICLYVGAR